MVRRLNISLEDVLSNIKNKDVVEAIAFNMMIKMTYVDSTMKGATYRRMKEVFGIGTDRLRRIVNNGVRYGLLTYDNQKLVANSLRCVNGHNFVLLFEHPKDNSTCQVKIIDIIRWIRERVVNNHIAMQNKAVVTYKKQVDPKSIKEYKSACKIANRKSIAGSYATLSNGRMKEILGVGYRGVRKVKDSLIKGGYIQNFHTNIETGINPEMFTSDAQKYLNENSVRGYFHMHEGKVCIHTSNTFKCYANPVCYIVPKKK